MPDGDQTLDPPPTTQYSDADPNYKVYNTNFDEEILAEELAEPAELERLDKSNAAAFGEHDCLFK